MTAAGIPPPEHDPFHDAHIVETVRMGRRNVKILFSEQEPIGFPGTWLEKIKNGKVPVIAWKAKICGNTFGQFYIMNEDIEFGDDAYKELRKVILESAISAIEEQLKK